MSGKEIWTKDQDIAVAGNASKLMIEIPQSEITTKDDPSQIYAYVSLSENGKLLSDNLLLFLSPKDVKLPKPSIHVTVSDTETGYKIILSSDRLSLSTYLYNDENEGFFSDNYFTLLPGVSKEVTFKTKLKDAAFTKKLKVRDLTTAF
jgi:beta-mannosidase